MRIGPLPHKLTLIFDGTCDFCTRSKRLVERLDRYGRVTAVPFQQPGVPEAAGLSVADCEAAAWALDDAPLAAAQGRRRRFRGAAAVNAALSTALGTRLPLLVYATPGIGWLQDRIYDWVARNRSRFPGDTPYCEQFPERCGAGIGKTGQQEGHSPS